MSLKNNTSFSFYSTSFSFYKYDLCFTYSATTKVLRAKKKKIKRDKREKSSKFIDRKPDKKEDMLFNGTNKLKPKNQILCITFLLMEK